VPLRGPRRDWPRKRASRSEVRSERRCMAAGAPRFYVAEQRALPVRPRPAAQRDARALGARRRACATAPAQELAAEAALREREGNSERRWERARLARCSRWEPRELEARVGERGRRLRAARVSGTGKNAMSAAGLAGGVARALFFFHQN
jgi:hypothetical protein